MSVMPIINLFNAYDLQADPYETDKINCQEVVDYCEARFRVVLQAMIDVIEEDKIWMSKVLFRELVKVIGSFTILSNSFGRSVASPTSVWQQQSDDQSTFLSSFALSVMTSTDSGLCRTLGSNPGWTF